MSIPTSDRYNLPTLTANETDPDTTYNFKIANQNELRITQLRANVETLLAFGVDYTLDNIGSANGGNLYLIGNYLKDDVFMIEPVTPELQSTTFTYMRAFSRAKIEASLDYLTNLAKRLLNLSNRAIKIPTTEMGVDVDVPGAAARRGRIIGWEDSATAPIKMYNASDLLDTVASGGKAFTVGIGATVKAFDLFMPNIGTSCFVELHAVVSATGRHKWKRYLVTNLLGEATLIVTAFGNLNGGKNGTELVEITTTAALASVQFDIDGSAFTSQQTVDIAIYTKTVKSPSDVFFTFA